MERQIYQVAVWTDGHGSYQARCCECEWRGKWRRQETAASDDAKYHGRFHAASVAKATGADQ